MCPSNIEVLSSINNMQMEQKLPPGRRARDPVAPMSPRSVFLDESPSSPPPLDRVTVCSTCDGDDSISISSVSSNEEEQPRSIFKTFWEKNQRDSQSMTVPRAPILPFVCQTGGDEDSSVNTYERTLQQRERPSPRSRRRIFSRRYLSESSPTLAQYPGIPHDRHLRKTQSNPLLTKQPMASCLRQSRFSGSFCAIKESSSHSERLSVSFREAPDVHVFERPLERWAAEGWSNWFH